MKRKPFDPNAPRPIRTWFRWHECCACKLEFRREPGWLRTGHSLRLGLYACAQCAPTEAEAHELFEQRWPGPGQPRPRAPQAPPRPFDTSSTILGPAITLDANGNRTTAMTYLSPGELDALAKQFPLCR